MTSYFKSLSTVIFAITLMFSLAVNMAQARVHPASMSSTLPSSSRDLLHSHSEQKNPSTTGRPMVDSLRRIPPSGPNPTQNK
ncbi:hypothetical protein I3843_13G039900 [Carya illinoinensis]|uniref:Uncharacterized protein n=1 Tax=Carya illinoinensis TaxID=32201 RepID=A0A922ALY2_CARIL|nr:hypothetical protein I3842_13G048200 [Carya illinoinensis]KAG7949046.1 hypothetical protein I3843_13G039900 [Carya illinoinensis]